MMLAPILDPGSIPLQCGGVNGSILPGFAPLPFFDEAGHAVAVQLEMAGDIFQTTGNPVAAFRQTCIGKRVLQNFLRNNEVFYLFGHSNRERRFLFARVELGAFASSIAGNSAAAFSCSSVSSKAIVA